MDLSLRGRRVTDGRPPDSPSAPEEDPHPSQEGLEAAAAPSAPV